MTENETTASTEIVATDNLATGAESRRLSPPSSTPILVSRSNEDILQSNSSIPTLAICSRSSSLEEHREQSTTISEGLLLLEPVVAESALESQPALNDPSHLEDVTFSSLSLLTPWFPEVNPEHPRARTWRTWRSRRKVVLWTCFTTAGLICIINFIWSAVARFKFKGISNDVVTLYQGDCASVRRWDTGIHVIINVLSTLLLSASNLTLQLIAAPTRKEVDTAHSKGIWLDIGVPSLKNLLNISQTNLLIWCCLAASSLPIHFLYNSAVFSSLTINQFGYAVVNEDFLTGSAWNTNTTNGRGPVVSGSPADNRAVESDSFSLVDYLQQDYQENLTKYHNLTKLECLKAYSKPLEPEPNLLLVSSGKGSPERFDSSLLSWGFHSPSPNNITHYPLCTLSFKKKQCQSLDSLTAEELNTFQLGDHTIDYCLNRPTDRVSIAAQTCHLQCSPVLILIVAIFNAFKCICILSVILWKREPTLSLLGDAIASFLDQPDEFTKHLGITSKREIVRSDKSWSGSKGVSLPWECRPSRWWSAATNRRWIFTIVLSTMLAITVATLMSVELKLQVQQRRSISFQSLWDRGFGTPNTDTIVQGGTDGLFNNTLKSNSMQVVLSVLYMLHNALFSCMMVASEWSGFITERKTLRVSSPTGIQRSSYFISMPLRYGIPVMVLFATEHWLLSQSYFIIRLIRTDWTGTPSIEWTISGASIAPYILAMMLAFLMVLVQLLHGYMRKFSGESSMPLVSTCSAAISANCHRPEADKEAHLLPVQWGATGKNGSEQNVCSFTTSRYVEAPTPGHEYLTYRGASARISDRKIPWKSHILK